MYGVKPTNKLPIFIDLVRATHHVDAETWWVAHGVKRCWNRPLSINRVRNTGRFEKTVLHPPYPKRLTADSSRSVAMPKRKLRNNIKPIDFRGGCDIFTKP